MDNQNLGYIILESAPEPGSINPPKILEASRDEVVIEAILEEADSINRNRRIYTKAAIDSGINNPMFQEKLKRKNLFGEANHPSSDDIKRQTTIDQTRMSHVINKVWWEGNILKGEVAATHTATGQDFAGLVRQGCEMAFSMRGLGGVVKKEGTITKVFDPLLIITYDWVIFPSFSNAYQTRVLKESTMIKDDSDLILNEGVLIPCNYIEGLKSYIMDESKDIKDTVDQLELNESTAELTTDKNNNLAVSFESDKGKVVLFTEETIRNEINDFFLNL